MDELAAKIDSEIRNQGGIPFARFMELALYCPVCGYYEKEGDNIGRRGDYYTSVSVGDLFGSLLACQFAWWFDQAWTPSNRPDRRRGTPARPVLQIIEAGAHRGDLAKDILQWFHCQRPDLFWCLEYWIIEPSRTRQEWQQRTLAAFPGHTRWAQDFPGLPPVAAASATALPYRLIFANELLDALPVHRLGWDAKARAWLEWGVTTRAGEFDWMRLSRVSGAARAGDSPLDLLERLLEEALPSAPGDARVASQAPGTARCSEMRRLLDVLPDEFIIELCPAAHQWWQTAASCLEEGKLVAIDYGRRFEEFLVPERAQGTLRVYRRHHVGGNLLASPGQQDITADVNFTLLEKAGESAGFKTEFYGCQSEFLTGIAARIWNGQQAFGSWTRERNRQFQTLTHPEHLGRSFKVLVQSRNTGEQIRGSETVRQPGFQGSGEECSSYTTTERE